MDELTSEEAPAWAKGFDMEFLREAARLFRAGMKQHTYGAFGLPKERDIADAMADNALAWTKAPNKRALEAVAIAKRLSRPSWHEDFAGRKASLMQGDMFVKALAGSWAGCKRILAGLEERHHPTATWVEAHVEDAELVKLLAASGFERVMTKISASSDLKGLFVRVGSNDELERLPAPLEPADAPSASILAENFISETMRKAILAEAERAAQWAQHYSGYNKRHTWTAFALCGFDKDDPGFIIKPSEMSKQWKAENPERLKAKCGYTAAADQFPVALAAAAMVPGKKERVRLMRLSAKGGELTRHADITDPDAGTRDGQLCRIHIPLQSHLGCLFRTWDLEGREHRTHFPERALCYLDTRKPHAVINAADVDRIHLVLDTWSSPELRELIAGNKKAPAKRRGRKA